MENEIYEKVDNSIKITTEVTEKKEVTYTMEFLLEQKKTIEDQLIVRQTELDEVNNLIQKAKELGVGEEEIK